MQDHIKNREEFMALLNQAAEIGIISDVRDNGLRNITFATSEGQALRIEWYTNMCTLHVPGASMWFDDISISNTHPSYKAALSLSFSGVKFGHIGILHDHLKETK